MLQCSKEIYVSDKFVLQSIDNEQYLYTWWVKVQSMRADMLLIKESRNKRKCLV